MTIRKIILIVILSIMSAGFFSGCIEEEDIPGTTTAGTTQELKKFSSVNEIREFLSSSAPASYAQYDIGFSRDAGMVEMEESIAVPAEGISAPAIADAPVSKSSEYSTTNIQVEGVDEADFIKNDGKYIYILSQNDLIIVDAFPAEEANILSKTKIPGRATNIFLNDDRLVVFTEDHDEIIYYPEYDFRPRTRYTQKTSALIYDISNREEPELLTDHNINGNYFQARMIGDYVYFIVKDSVYYYDDYINVPVIRQGSEKIVSPDIYYFDNPEQNYVFHTIASFNTRSDNDINAKSFMMGYSDNLYVSTNNIYITYRKNLPARFYQDQQKDRFFKVVVPLLPSDVQNKIKRIETENLSAFEQWDRISSILEETYNRMDESEKRELSKKIEQGLQEYDIRIARERDKTIIQKIRINKGEIEYDTKGEVPGTLLNQFSMDEFSGYFRIATTSQIWTRSAGSIQFNNVYVMDDDLEITGKLEEIAKDERIFSTRFLGERLYMVTFKRIDPLFVIDLSDPKRPEILGELKIPGFSDYLHPYDENHIIGIGKETGDNQWGGTSIKGVKLSLFDVSDVNNPEQLDKYEIGASGTDSEALREHKAFLFDKEKNLLVIPVREIKGNELYDNRYGYRQRVWQGAYVFGLTPEEGFELKGKISHLDDLEEQRYYWGSPYAVRRSLYMDDVLYTISSRKILMNDLEDISEINEIELPENKNEYPYYGKVIREEVIDIGIPEDLIPTQTR